MPDLEVVHWFISENGYGWEAKVHPDRAAVAKFLREYLVTKVWDIHLKETVEAVLPSELAGGLPQLYSLAVVVGTIGELSRKNLLYLRSGLLPPYSPAMLVSARALVPTHQQGPRC